MGKRNHIRVPVYLTPEEFARLDYYCNSLAVSKSDALRQMFRDHWAAWQEELIGRSVRELDLGVTWPTKKPNQPL